MLREVGKLQKKILKLAEVGSWGLGKKPSHNIKVRGEAVKVGVEATAGYPKYLAKIINECDHTRQQILNVH